MNTFKVNTFVRPWETESTPNNCHSTPISRIYPNRSNIPFSNTPSPNYVHVNLPHMSPPTPLPNIPFISKLDDSGYYSYNNSIDKSSKKILKVC